ncbi:hypothetical protein FF1_043624 [Malus domestica]
MYVYESYICGALDLAHPLRDFVSDYLRVVSVRHSFGIGLLGRTTSCSPVVTGHRSRKPTPLRHINPSPLQRQHLRRLNPQKDVSFPEITAAKSPPNSSHRRRSTLRHPTWPSSPAASTAR